MQFYLYIKKPIFEINCDYRTNYIHNNSEEFQLMDYFFDFYIYLIKNTIYFSELNEILKIISKDIEPIIKSLNKLGQKFNNNSKILLIKLNDFNSFLINNKNKKYDFKLIEKKIKILRK